MTHSSRIEFWGKTTVTNVSIFSVSHITRSFTDRILRAQKSVWNLKETHPSYPMPPWE